MRALAAAVAAAILALATASSAAALDDTDFFVLGFSDLGRGQHPISQVDVPVKVTGALAVDYHGDAATGCAAKGLCDVRGSTTWDPGPAAELSVTTYTQGGRRQTAARLTFSARGGATTATEVTRSNGGRCSETVGGRNESPLARVSPAGIALSLVDPFQSDFLATPCPGPLHYDLISLLPTRPVPRSVLHGGTSNVDLSTTQAFAAGGFAGTLHSTVKLEVGSVTRRAVSDDGPPETLHSLSLDFRIARLTGRVRVGFQGDPGVCAGLDACGTTGTMNVTPGLSRGTLRIAAITTARRSRADLLAALGLRSGRTPSRIEVGGPGVWRSPSGSLAATVSRGDGEPACGDVAPLSHGLLVGHRTGPNFVLTYYASAGAGMPLHTRCAGPLLTDLDPDQILARGSVPLKSLRRRTLTVRLRAGSRSGEADGYATKVSSDLAVTLKRTRVRERVVRF